MSKQFLLHNVLE
ncbi:hypothetical protein RDI58_014525 [Solanum bulbocastanum]